MVLRVRLAISKGLHSLYVKADLPKKTASCHPNKHDSGGGRRKKKKRIY